MCQCLIFLDEPLPVAKVLVKLSKGTATEALMAYQIAFDMYESATQQFLSRVQAAVRKTAPVPPADKTEKPKQKEKKEEKKDPPPPPPVRELSSQEAELLGLRSCLLSCQARSRSISTFSS